MEYEDKLILGKKLINDTIKEYGIKHIFALFSGGHDSLLTSKIASENSLFGGCIYANTLVGTKETRQFIYDTCKENNWVLYEQKPRMITYEMLLVKYGYPNPATHSMVYRYLKDRAFETVLGMLAKKYHCKKSEIGCVTGVRRWESNKRMHTVKPVKIYKSKMAKSPNRIWIAPCWDFKENERDLLINDYKLTRNKFADIMGHSYECMCGCNLEDNERKLRFETQPVYEHAEILREKMVKAAFDLQQFLLENGIIDKEDAKIDENRLEWGWHLKRNKGFEYNLEEDYGDIDDTLCSHCSIRNNEASSTLIDIELEYMEHNNLISVVK